MCICEPIPPGQDFRNIGGQRKGVGTTPVQLYCSPDYFATLTTDGGFAGTFRRLLCGLDDGVAVLHRCWCGRLAVLAQHCAGLIWGVSLSKGRIHCPGWATSRARDWHRFWSSRAWNSDMGGIQLFRLCTDVLVYRFLSVF